jgi:hypothetical protein
VTKAPVITSPKIFSLPETAGIFCGLLLSGELFSNLFLFLSEKNILPVVKFEKEKYNKNYTKITAIFIKLIRILIPNKGIKLQHYRAVV